MLDIVISIKKRGVRPEPLAGRLSALVVHTLAVYLCAVHLSPWLVGRSFAWSGRILQFSAASVPGDWYLQHMELASVIPALIVGHVTARQLRSAATWAWVIPTVVLSYRFLQYHAPSSVLLGNSTTAFSYFFHIERVMPTTANPTASNPVRVLAQMTITAPFYTGLAYSLGAWSARQRFMKGLFGGGTAPR